MSAGSVVSVVLTLAVVLGLMGVALKLLRKYTTAGSTRDGAIKMEVMQRLTLGQRQGMAVVRVGTRVLAVSMGDGGVHPIAELDPTEFAVEPSGKITEAAAQSVAKIAESFQSLRALAPLSKPLQGMTDIATQATSTSHNSAPESQRISYIAPIEDFHAVLNMAMSGAARS